MTRLEQSARSSRGAPLACALACATALAALLASLAAGCGDRAVGGDGTLRAALDAVVDAGAPGALLLVQVAGAAPRGLAAGTAVLARHTAMQPDTPQHVGSLTKTFTAVLVLQLVDEGMLELDQPIAPYLPPDLVPGADRITIRQLLQHTSGLRDSFAVGAGADGIGAVWQPLRRDPSYVWSPRALVELAVAAGPEASPGERYAYSNTGYVLLGMILEAVTGRPVERLFAERIIGPLGLHDTMLPTSARDGAVGRAHCYSRFLTPDAASLQDMDDLDPSFAWVAGALISTTADVARFYSALLLDGALLSPRMRDEMRTSIVPTGQAETWYGLGIIRTGSGASQLWWHNGSWPGCTATAGVLTEQGVTVVQLQNVGLADQDDALTAAISSTLAAAFASAGASL